MSLKASIGYQLKDNIKSIVIFYVVIICVISLIASSIAIPGNDGNTNLNGMEFATVIFLFILGLNSFKENFHMLLQNGLSRKTLFIGAVLTMIAISIGMAFIDSGLLILSNLVADKVDGLIVISTFEMGYSEHIAGISKMQIFAERLIFQIMMNLTVALIGYFITIAYYLMNKTLKTIVSISIPVGLFVVLPLIDSTFANGSISKLINDMIDLAFGIKTQNPYCAMIAFLLASVVFGSLGWLMSRRAIIKNN